MSYTKTPTGDTYGTKTVNLFYPWDNRGDGVNVFDTNFKNLLAEPIGKGEYYQLIKRDGSQTFALNSPVNGTTIGMYYWRGEPSGNVFQYIMVVSVTAAGQGQLTFYDPFSGVLVTSSVLAGGNVYNGNMNVQWSEFLYQNGTVDLLFTVGGKLFRAQSGPPGLPGNPVTTSAAANFQVVYLDGYAFVTDGTAIWNSNLNDPTTWSASNFINTDSYPDKTIGLGRSGPYIVALGEQSVQFFYDAANPTGTPLAANTGATQHIGYSGGFAQNGDDIYFVGTMNGTHPSVYKVTGINITEIASFQFARFWLQQGNVNQTVSDGAIGASGGAILELNGHSCYYVRTSPTPYNGGVPPVNPAGSSYIYDFKSQQWSQLGYQGSESFLLTCSTQVVNGFHLPSMTYYALYGDTSGNIHRFNPATYTDDGVNFEVRFRTRPLDFDTYRIKFASRVLLHADNTSSPVNCQLRWTDDDYSTYGGFAGLGRQIPLNSQLKHAWALGNFRARAWELTFSGNYPMRFRALEVDYNLGQA